MKYSGIIFLLLLFVFSCQKDDDLQPLGEQLEWVCGADNFKVVQELEIPEAAELALTMETNSLCPNSGIGLLIENGGTVLFEDIIASFPNTTSVEVPANSTIKITTEVKNLDNEILCVWLGNVEIVLNY